MHQKSIEKVAVVAPAGLASEARIEAGLKELHSYGVAVTVVPSGEPPRHYLAGSDNYRAEALRRAWALDVDAIWALRGGFGCIRTLNALKTYGDPKMLLGFSDVSALLVNAPNACHAPVVTQLPNLDVRSKTALAAILSGQYSSIPLCEDRVVLRPGKVSGSLVGGNLTVLGSLCGTPWQPTFEDKILFLEDVGEPPYRIDRVWTQLRLSGILDGVRGLVLGRFTGIAAGEQLTLRNLFEEMASDISGPVVEGLPVGHSAENVPVPLGVPVMMDTSTSELLLDW